MRKRLGGYYLVYRSRPLPNANPESAVVVQSYRR